MPFTVKNLIGTCDDRCPGGCANWLEHWKRNSEGHRSGLMDKGVCAVVDCFERAVCGGHVQRIGFDDTSAYIIPLCDKCNKREADYLVVTETWFAAAKQLPTCGTA